MEFNRDLVGKCGIYCGACRIYVLKKCKGCSDLEVNCPYLKCLKIREQTYCGECEEFPCEKHYGPMAVYARKYLNWKKQETTKL